MHRRSQTVDTINLTKTIDPISKDKTPGLSHNFNTIGKIVGRSCFILVRHAERSDDSAPEKIKKDHIFNRSTIKQKSLKPRVDYSAQDPDISEYGRFQALETGQVIAHKINKFKKEMALADTVTPRVISSPYWRCLRTASRIIDGMNQQNMSMESDTIFVEDGVMEWQNDPNNMMSEKELKLIFNNVNEDSKQKHLGNYYFEQNKLLDYQNNRRLKKKLFEDKFCVKERYDDLIKNLIELSYKDQDSYIYIIVGHATCIEYFSQVADDIRQRADYCSINIFLNQVYSRDTKAEADSNALREFQIDCTNNIQGPNVDSDRTQYQECISPSKARFDSKTNTYINEFIYDKLVHRLKCIMKNHKGYMPKKEWENAFSNGENTGFLGRILNKVLCSWW